MQEKERYGEIAYLDLVGHAAGGCDGEGGEDRVLRVEVGDGVFLVDGALGAAVDFVLIRVRQSWAGGMGMGFLCSLFLWRISWRA